jgi:hypothetical protein
MLGRDDLQSYYRYYMHLTCWTLVLMFKSCCTLVAVSSRATTRYISPELLSWCLRGAAPWQLWAACAAPCSLAPTALATTRYISPELLFWCLRGAAPWQLWAACAAPHSAAPTVLAHGPAPLQVIRSDDGQLIEALLSNSSTNLLQLISEKVFFT